VEVCCALFLRDSGYSGYRTCGGSDLGEKKRVFFAFILQPNAPPSTMVVTFRFL
jgi:hypothetical protein